jgi:dipeptidyl aminopeptidase/acylaminoacyl peptidase
MKSFLNCIAKTGIRRLYPKAIVLLLFFELVTCSVSGQVAPKKHLTDKDYHLWSHLDLSGIAPKGDYLSYQLRYEDSDTVFVKSVVGDKTYHYPKGSNGQFYNQEYFVCQEPEQMLCLTHLTSGKQQRITDVLSYEIAGPLLLVLRQQKGEPRVLYRYDTTGGIKKIAANVQAYKVSPDDKHVAYLTASPTAYTAGVTLLNTIKEDTGTGIDTATSIATNTVGPYQQLKWSNNSKQLAFLQKEENNCRLHYYSIPENKRFEFEPSEYNFPQGMAIISSSLQLSQDGQRVFFKIQQQAAAKTDDNAVQIWNAADKWLYPAEKAIDGWNKVAKMAVWEPTNHYFLQLTDNDQPQGMLTVNERYIITYNKQDFEPQFKYQADRNLYITDIKTGVRKLWLEALGGTPNHLVFSPKGNYICYFKKGKWYNYDIARDLHFDLTPMLKEPLANINHDMPDEAETYRNPGWTTDEKSILLYDQYDLWQVTPDGAKATRLTDGREKGIVFRLVPLKPEQLAVSSGGDHFIAGLFDLSKTVLLSATADDYSTSGYYFWKNGTVTKALTYSNKKVDGLLKAPADETFVWTEQNFENPLRICVKKGKEKVVPVLQSNLQQQHYFWGKARLISYTNSIGKPLKGILFYPADYQQGSQYPMIVHVYERQTPSINEYWRPSLYNTDGFNVSNLTTKGYFVLMPDIAFEIGKVGFSAVDCTTAAVKTVLDIGVVDEKKIGIIGHSFGGFETDFIITQTNMFAAAVAGAAITDNVSNYLSIARNTNHPNYFRIESFQSRMGKSLFEDPKIYLDNSPILQAANITTPLLSWTGLRDLHIDTTQTFEFYFAMRRLGKKHIMLAYPDEEHAMEKKEHDADLTQRTQLWFDHYLKGQPAAQWMKQL